MIIAEVGVDMTRYLARALGEAAVAVGRAIRNHVRHLENLGYKVTLEVA